MKKKLSLFLLITIIAIFMAACGSNSSTEEKSNASAEPKETEKTTELTIKHFLGETKVKKNPEKVVVFDFGTLDTLDALGVEVAGLPREGTVPSYLEKYNTDKYENVGSLKEPDFEKINELQPDLIIISARQQDLYKEFQEIAPTIYLGVDTTSIWNPLKKMQQRLVKFLIKKKK